MAEVRCVSASCVYGDVVALRGLDLRVADGEFVALHGPADAGKTTALRMIAGIEPVASGQVFIGGTDVTDAPPARRNVALVFANSTPSARLTIADHIGLPLASADAGVVSAAGASVGLDRLGRRLKALNPFERQLVALARAVVVTPAVLLLDEPTDGLDGDARRELRARIARVHESRRLTTIYATRDAVGAAALADRVVVLHRGVVQQTTAGADLRARPATVHAALAFDASLNVRRARLERGEVRYGALRVADLAVTGLTYVTFAVSPAALRLDVAGVPVKVLAADERFAYVQVPGLAAPDEPLAVLTSDGAALIGTSVHLAIEPSAVHLFDPATGTRLN